MSTIRDRLKKMSALLLASVMLLTNTAFAEPSAAETVADETTVAMSKEMTDAVTLLKKLNIVDADFVPSTELATRAFAVSMIARMETDEITDTYSPKYSDVGEGTTYMKEIMYLSNRNYIGGYDNGKFLPDQAITYGELSKMLIKAIGYTLLAEHNGGYPKGYMKTLNSLEILKPVSNSETTISTEELVVAIYRALTVEALGIDNVSGGNINLESGNSLLFSNKDVFELKGVVTEAAGASVGYSGSVTKGNQIRIGNYVMYTDIPDPMNYLGKTVTGYVRENKDDGTYELLSITKTHYKDEYEIILDEDFKWSKDSSGAFTFTYRKDTNREKSIKTAPTAKIYYNGRITSDYTVIGDALDKKQGKIRILETNTETLVFIYSYINVVVSSVDTGSYTVKDLFSYGKLEFPVDDEYANVSVYKEDKKVGFDSIKAGDVLSIYRSTDNSYNDIYIGSEKINGVVDSMRYDEYRIDGVFYEITSELKDALANGKLNISDIRINDKLTFDLNVYGKACNVTVVRDDYRYAYMYRHYAFSDFEVNDGRYGLVELYDVASEENTTLYYGEKLTVNGVLYRGNAIANAIDACMDNWDPAATSMMVKIKTDENNIVKGIEFPLRNYTGPDKADRFVYEASYTYQRVLGGRIAAKYILSSDTVILEPYPSVERVNKYTQSYFNDYAYHDFEVYDSDELGFTGLVVLPTTEGYLQKNEAIYYGDPVYLVEGISEAYFEEEGYAGTVLEAYENGGTKLVELAEGEEGAANVDTDIHDLFKDKCYNVPTVNGTRYGQYGYGNLTFKDIKRGDLIQIGKDVDGKIDRFRIISRLPEWNAPFDNLYAGSSAYEPYSMFTYGTVTFTNKRGFVLDYGNGKRTYTQATVPVLIYYKDGGYVEKGSMADVTEGERVMVRGIKLGLKFIIVVR